MIVQFSVLMSIYHKENPEFFKESLDSILSQTVKASEIVLVEDGPLTEELYSLIDTYVSNNPDLFNIVILEKNMGLGLALREGILHCNYEIVARMDTDDIAKSDRFEVQLSYLLDNDLDICSSSVLEFETDINMIIGKRYVPLTHEEICKYQKKRSSFNHMAVMFKKSSVLKAGNYEHCPLMEDDMLWVRMIISGAKCGNIEVPLVYARTNKSMIARRGGFEYFKKYKSARKKIYKTKYISWWNYFESLIIQFVVCMMPAFMRKFIFFHILHRR